MAARIGQINQADRKLRKRWTHELTPARQPSSMSEQNPEHLQAQTRHFCEALNRFRAELEKTRAMPAKTRAKVNVQIEHLYAELASVETETAQACARIMDAITSFEATLYQDVNEISDAVARELTNAANALNAELEALYPRGGLSVHQREVR
jgi:hypothetical protein